MAKYNALDLAKKIVNIAGDMGFSITSLQLQKVMYYVQGNYMKAFSEKAFEEGYIMLGLWSSCRISLEIL